MATPRLLALVLALGCLLVAGSYDEEAASRICDLLLTNGANVNLEGSGGRTALDIALQEERTKMAEFLRSRGGKTAGEL